MAVLEDWDRHTVEAQLTDVTGLDYFRRLPEVMAANISNRGLLELFTTMSAEASSPAHPAHSFIQRRYTDNLATLASHLQHAVDTGDIATLPSRDHHRSPPRHRHPRRHRTAMAPRPQHRRHHQHRDLRQPHHHRMARGTCRREPGCGVR